MIRLSNSVRVGAMCAMLVLAGCSTTGAPSREKPAATHSPSAKTQSHTATSKTAKAHSKGASPSGGPVITANPNQATVVFFREKKFAGGAITFKVREGNEELGKLSSGTYFVSVVQPGAHTYVVHSEAKDELHIEVEAGQIYYVQGAISLGLLVGHPNLSPSDAATFDSMKAKLKNSAASAKS